MVGLRLFQQSKKCLHQNQMKHRILRSSQIFKIIWILIILEACNVKIMSNAKAISIPKIDSQMNNRIRRDVVNSQFTYNDFLNAIGRLHFGPLLKLRSMSNRAGVKFASDPHREKKALSYLSRFYPIFQSSHIPIQPLQSLKSSSRRRLTGSYSGEASYPGGRSQRPIMRLRWGK